VKEKENQERSERGGKSSRKENESCLEEKERCCLGCGKVLVIYAKCPKKGDDNRHSLAVPYELKGDFRDHGNNTWQKVTVYLWAHSARNDLRRQTKTFLVLLQEQK